YQGRYLSIKETSVFILLLLLFWLIFLTKLLIYFASCKLTIVTVTPQQANRQAQDRLACEEYEWIAGIAPKNE
ncbi:hypothetical protein OMO38_18185, partial [Chryseobacterium sp. 09-1422]